MTSNNNFYIDIQGEYYQFNINDILYDTRGHSNGFRPDRVPKWLIKAYNDKVVSIDYAYSLYLSLDTNNFIEVVHEGDYLIKGNFNKDIVYVSKTVFNHLAKPWLLP